MTSRARHIGTAALAAVLIVGCADERPDSPPGAVRATGPAAGASAGADQEGSPPGGLVPGRVTELTTGLSMPWGLTFLPDGSALVSGRASAEIRHVPAGGGPASLVGSVPDAQVSAEGGLLGLTTSPGFTQDRIVYAYVSAEPTNRVVMLRIGEDMRSLTQDRVVIDGIPTGNRHHGGRLAFGPDGNLWITTGDAFTREIAPDRGTLGGKVLRLRPDGTVPPDNPFGTAVFTTGHRNVQGITFGPDGTGYVAELGQNAWDEVNVLLVGGDYGWPAVEGPDGGGIRPIFWMSPADASPSGIAYAGGALWMAGLRGQRLWRLPVTNGRPAGDPVAYLEGEYGRLRTVHVAPDGALWVTTSNTDRATLGGEPARPGDDRILRIELVPVR